MNLLLRMAWRNVWRNRRRSILLLCAMATGLAGVLFSIAFTNGWLEQMVQGATETYEGHVKVYAEGYRRNPVVEHAFLPPPELGAALDADPRVAAWADRIRVQGLVSTAARSTVAAIVGIDPARERNVSVLARALREGTYLEPGTPDRVLLGRRLAEKLHAEVGRKVVLMAQQLGGDIGSGAYRVAGIFDTGNASFDEGTVCILAADARAMLGLGDQVTETAIVLHDRRDCAAVRDALAARLEGDGLEVYTWRELLPSVSEMLDVTNRFVLPYYAIFYLAMAFGLFNTLLMAIGERTHEIGVLRAVGMSRRRIVAVILLESTLLSLVAATVGGVVGWGVVQWFYVRGIDLTRFAAGTEFLGVGHVLRPALDAAGTAWAVAAALVVSLLVAVVPALRAARMIPVKALRTLT